MAKTKDKPKKEKKKQKKEAKVTLSLANKGAEEAAFVARSEILLYAERFKSANSKRPILQLADKVEQKVLDSFALIILGEKVESEGDSL
jgi:hypothetical protein